MTAADEFQTLHASAAYWSAYDPACKCELGSTALRTSNGGLVVIDPIPLALPAWEELTERSPLRAILITNENHARDAVRFRKSYGAPVVTTPLIQRALPELNPDVTLLEGELLYGITALSIPGATPGETAYYHADSRTLVLGDAVINLDSEKGLEFLPAKYCTDPEQNRASLQKLLNFEFQTLTFAHGSPVTQGAREKLQALLSS